jgi:hypothetical protein
MKNSKKLDKVAEVAAAPAGGDAGGGSRNDSVATGTHDPTVKKQPRSKKAAAASTGR